MDNYIESLVQEISGRLDLMESQLPRRIDALMSRSKLPFKAMLYRESLIWRMVELSRGAFDNLKSDKLANAVILTRAAVETSAALWYLHAKLKAAVESGTLGDTDEYLMRLAMGSRSDAEMPEAISVLTFVDRVNKDVEGFRHQYDRLSEYAHPNWAGTSLLYSETDTENFWTEFGQNLRGVEGTKSSGVTNLSVALMCFERSYNLVADLMPAFIDLCEKHVRETPQPALD